MESGISCFVLPLLAETARLYVPAFTALAALNFSVLLPDPGAAILTGAKVAEIPLGNPEREKATGALKPPLTATANTTLMLEPGEMVTELVEGVTRNPGALVASFQWLTRIEASTEPRPVA